MSALAISACCAVALVVLVSAYLTLLFRGLRNELVIGDAIEAMRSALDAEPLPQRELLAAVADTLMSQDRAAAKIELALAGLACDSLPAPAELLSGLLDLPEPQLLVADFLRAHAGGQGIFTSVAADVLRAATTDVFGDLAADGLADLDQLLPLADDGRIASVALASFGLALDPGPPRWRAPRTADLEPGRMAAIVQALNRTARRQLRLATLLHGQAEAMMRIRRGKRRGLAALWLRARNLASFPLSRNPNFQLADLDQLAVALDAVGEVLHMADELAASGDLTRAAHKLAMVRVPAPPGFPGRIYLQESLAQARPLARIGAAHRLAVCRWTVTALETAPRPGSYPARQPGPVPAPASPTELER
jgi:hypothetical protein